jgi:hypothetical protein
MMWVTERIFMSNAVVARNKPDGNWPLLNKQVGQAKVLLREMRETIEDVEDARTIERAKRAHGNKPRIAWSQVKKELDLP